MGRFQEEARTFGARKLAEMSHARQVAAMQLACGIDLSAALDAAPELRDRLICRVERVIERERLKGMRRHWSYDLNRHIALKQVLDRLRGLAGEPPAAGPREKARSGSMKPNGARRRR
jgi:hypothetical protein